MNCNCVICGNEIDDSELEHKSAHKRINITTYKVCKACFNKANPEEDYLEVRSIISNYIHGKYIE